MEIDLLGRLLRRRKGIVASSGHKGKSVEATDSGFELQKTIDDLNRKIKDDINELFPHPNIKERVMEDFVLDWQEHMPQIYNDNPTFSDWDITLLTISQETFGMGSTIIHLSFGNTIGYIYLDYSDGFCEIETKYKNNIGEKIRTVEDSKNPLGNAVGLSRFSEALDFIKAERAYRLNSNQPNQPV